MSDSMLDRFEEALEAASDAVSELESVISELRERLPQSERSELLSLRRANEQLLADNIRCSNERDLLKKDLESARRVALALTTQQTKEQQPDYQKALMEIAALKLELEELQDKHDEATQPRYR